jgi:hypothetical protein
VIEHEFLGRSNHQQSIGELIRTGQILAFRDQREIHGCTDTKMEGDIISLLLFLKKKEGRLNI